MTAPNEPSSDDLVSPPAAGGRRWLWPTATVTLAVLGVGVLVAAALSPGDGATTVAETGPSPTPTVRATTTPSTTPDTASPAEPTTIADTPIAELADPSWIARISAAGSIPERALAAYAGAAIAVADTDPECGLGWNTLAAIGYVETEHATMNGAVLNDDGTVTPAIIGIALDGTETDAIADTDGGALDGDAVWDRAVGPFQFIPSTWAESAQDGDRDGNADVNQIDDAALAAAVHLCEVGGDLTVSENWIAAIGAYNSSVSYNNRVAEAADTYATLR